jgi:hypothetical protein
MKKRIMFLCLGILLFTCTLAFSEVSESKGFSENAKAINQSLSSTSLKGIDTIERKINELSSEDEKERLTVLCIMKKIRLLGTEVSFLKNERPGFFRNQKNIDEDKRKRKRELIEAKASQKKMLEKKLEPLELDVKLLSNALKKLSNDGSNYNEVVTTEVHDYLNRFKTLSENEKAALRKDLLNDGSNVEEICTKAIKKEKANNDKVQEAKKSIDDTAIEEVRAIADEDKESPISEDPEVPGSKKDLEKESEGGDTPEDNSAKPDNRSEGPVKTEASGTETPSATSEEGKVRVEGKKEELRVRVWEGKRIHVENDKKINIEKRVIPKSEIREVESIVVRGKEVFLHEYEKKEDRIEIRGYGEYGLLPGLKKGNERTLARLYDKVLEGRERKEEGEVEGKGVREDKGSKLFEKLGHLSVKEAERYVRKEVRGMSFIPNVVKSVGSEEERKYVYKNIGEREEGEKNRVWIEGINEVKNYGEDENSIGKYSDNKVGTIIGYVKEVGEGKLGMYMKGSKHEMNQGGGNSGEVVNVGLGVCGGYGEKVEVKWLAYVSGNKYRTEREWEEGKAKGEFSGLEVGVDVEGGMKVKSGCIGIVKPYIGIGARKSSYGKIEEKGSLVDVKIEEGSYERCVGRIGVEGRREISRKVEIVGRVEYERVIKGERGEVKLEGTRDNRRREGQGRDRSGRKI